MPSILDADAYPHIFTSILLSAPYPSLLALRTTTRVLRDAIDARLAKHILVFEDGRLASRLAPRGRLPRPLSEVGEHVRVLDIKPPRLPLLAPTDPLSLRLTIPEPFPIMTSPLPGRCRCGLSESIPPPHLRPLALSLPNLTTVRRWGDHTCWSPAAKAGITHFRAEADDDPRIADEAMWYLHSPSASSRFNRLHLPGGGVEKYSLAGERVRELFEKVDKMGGVEACESADEEAEAEAEAGEDADDEGEVKGAGTRERKNGKKTPAHTPAHPHASRADGFAAFLALLWLDDPEDEDESWALVDVEHWSVWDDAERGDVARIIKERVWRCLVNAGWDEDELEAAEDKLRFLSGEEYRAEVGEEVAALEMDDHAWKF